MAYYIHINLLTLFKQLLSFNRVLPGRGSPSFLPYKNGQLELQRAAVWCSDQKATVVFSGFFPLPLSLFLHPGLIIQHSKVITGFELRAESVKLLT